MLHEHFHQLQYSQTNYYADVNALNLSGGDELTWCMLAIPKISNSRTSLSMSGSITFIWRARAYRCTIGEYIRRLRIENACSALSKFELSLSSIAVAAGFADQSHFSRTFKRVIGMTPVEYRGKLAAR